MTKPLRLHYAPDNASLCVRLALEDMAIPYETVLVDRSTQEQRSNTYLTLNPNGLIPTLETPFGPMFETGAILLWLADTHPNRLFPDPNDPARQTALTWLFWLSNTMHPALRMSFYPHLFGLDTQNIQGQARLRIEQHLDLLEAQWPQLEAFGLLGVYLAPMLRWCALYGGDPASFSLQRWPALLQFARTSEATAPALLVATAEGLGPTPFSAPSLPNPPEGSAL